MRLVSSLRKQYHITLPASTINTPADTHVFGCLYTEIHPFLHTVLTPMPIFYQCHYTASFYIILFCYCAFYKIPQMRFHAKFWNFDQFFTLTQPRRSFSGNPQRSDKKTQHRTAGVLTPETNKSMVIFLRMEAKSPSRYTERSATRAPEEPISTYFYLHVTHYMHVTTFNKNRAKWQFSA